MALLINGLVKDFFLSNNPIFVNIEETNVFDFFTVKVGTYPESTITPINKKATIDISSYVKSLLPLGTNMVRLAIVVSSYRKVSGNDQLLSSTTLNKYFIRGGKRGSQTNTTAISESILKPVDKIPYWADYLTTYSYLKTKINPAIIAELLLNPDGRTDVDRRKVKGCNSTYVKFLNSLGGYSYWMFEGVADQQKNTNEGLINNTRMIDLGNSYDQELELYSKVPKSYIALIQDLIISPEIYIYRLGEEGVVWDRYYSANNTLEVNPAKNAQSVKVKLKPFNKFNPQLVWE